jgi:membrane-associated phospholipid phosphatase
MHSPLIQSFYFKGFLLWLVIGFALLLSFDKPTLFLWINGHHHPITDFLFAHFTHVGDGLFFLVTALVFTVVSRRWVFHFLAAFALSSLLSLLCKEWLFHGIPRPKHFFETLGVPIRLIDGVTVHSFNSFPSGHTLSAFAVFYLLSLYFNKPVISIIALCLAMLAGFSRVYIAQHFVMDVMVGSIIGVGSVVCTYLLLERLFQKYNQANINRPLIRLIP